MPPSSFCSTTIRAVPAASVRQTDSNTFLSVLDSAIGRPGEHRPLGLVIVQVENFGKLVSARGYRQAAALLTRFESHLRNIIRDQDALVRVGEARFAIVIADLRDDGHIVLAANKILRTMDEEIEIGGDRVRLSLRLGMALSPQHAADSDSLLQVAETALLVAAEDNKRYCLYAPDTMDRVINLWGLEQDLDDAVQNGELELFYQPKIAVATGLPCGAEALMRWSSPTRGFVPPDVFIPMADSTGRIETLTWFALNAASRQNAQWSDKWGPLTVAVNVTPNIIEHSDLMRLAQNAIGLWDLAPDQLVIELTEGALMRKPEQSHHVLNEIRSTGIKVAIDDFGTGYSSLAYFKNIPADELKIDKSFVLNMLNDEADGRIVRAVISLAHDFGLKVTAEGVENSQTADALTELGCDYLQGYYYSRPVTQGDFCTWLLDYPPPA